MSRWGPMEALGSLQARLKADALAAFLQMRDRRNKWRLKAEALEAKLVERDTAWRRKYMKACYAKGIGLPSAFRTAFVSFTKEGKPALFSGETGYTYWGTDHVSGRSQHLTVRGSQPGLLIFNDGQTAINVEEAPALAAALLKAYQDHGRVKHLLKRADDPEERQKKETTE